MSSNKLNIFIQDLRNTYTVLQQLELCIKTCNDTLRAFDDLTNHIDELDLDVLDAKLDEINAIISSADLDTLTADVAQLKTSVSALQTIVTNIQESVNTISTTLYDLSSSVSTLSNNVSQIENNVSTLQTLVNNIQNSITTLNTSVGQNTNDIINLKGRVSAIETKHIYQHNIEAALYDSTNQDVITFRISVVTDVGQITSWEQFIQALRNCCGMVINNYSNDMPAIIGEVDTVTPKIQIFIAESHDDYYVGRQYTRFYTEGEGYLEDIVIQLL